MPWGTFSVSDSVSGQSFECMIDRDTTDVYVMPAGALYWYGNEITTVHVTTDNYNGNGTYISEKKTNYIYIYGLNYHARGIVYVEIPDNNSLHKLNVVMEAEANAGGTSDISRCFWSCFMVNTSSYIGVEHTRVGNKLPDPLSREFNTNSKVTLSKQMCTATLTDDQIIANAFYMEAGCTSRGSSSSYATTNMYAVWLE